MASVFERMVAILDELPAIGKTQKNQQQGFNFRGHDDVLNALNPLLAKHGVFIIPDVLERIPAERQTKSGSTMYEVNLHVRFFFYGADGDSFTASTWGEGTDSGDKATNKAMTMAFKNVLIQAFAINTSDNVDADHHAPEETTRNNQQPERTRSYAPPPARPQSDGQSGDGDFVIPLGAHKGLTIAQVYDLPADSSGKNDGAGYLSWAAYKMEPKAQSGKDFQEAAQRFLQAKKDAYDKSVLDPTGDPGPAEAVSPAWGQGPQDDVPFLPSIGGDR